MPHSADVSLKSERMFIQEGEGGAHSRPPAPFLKIVKVVSSIMPWLIIAGLLWAGLFIKPAPVGSTVQPPVLERRDHYYGLAILGDRLLLAGSSGKIVAIGKDGQATRLKTPTERNLQDIAVWDDKQAVAVGNDGVIIHTADGGISWTEAKNVPRSMVANKLTRIRVTEGGGAIAVGEMGALLMTRDYGKTWIRIRPEEDLAWNDVAILPGGKVLAVGEFGRMVTTQDDGGKWADVQSPLKSSLMAVAFRDGQNGVAVGLEGAVLVTRDGGQHWIKVAIDTRDHLYDISWDTLGKRWIGGGHLGRWIGAEEMAIDWKTGRLDARDLSWHTRVMPVEGNVWFAGANIGRWDGKTWQPLGDAHQNSILFTLPSSLDMKVKP